MEFLECCRLLQTDIWNVGYYRRVLWGKGKKKILQMYSLLTELCPVLFLEWPRPPQKPALLICWPCDVKQGKQGGHTPLSLSILIVNSPLYVLNSVTLITYYLLMKCSKWFIKTIFRSLMANLYHKYLHRATYLYKQIQHFLLWKSILGGPCQRCWDKGHVA